MTGPWISRAAPAGNLARVDCTLDIPWRGMWFLCLFVAMSLYRVNDVVVAGLPPSCCEGYVYRQLLLIDSTDSTRFDHREGG